MAEQNEQEVSVQKSYLDMSDEEMLNVSAPAIDLSVVEEQEQEAPATETQEVEQEVAVTDAEEDAVDKTDESIDAPTEEAGVDTETTAEVKDETGALETDKPAAFDYEAEYKRLLTPFKANGRDIAVTSVDDAISLMQMGANYSKKMAALKPNLKLMKLLENNGMLTEEKLSFLIDLDKKNPAAINKLLQDSGVDPLDLDAEKASEYKQTTYTVDDREIELDTVLDEIQGTPSYNRTLDIVSSKWDGASKQVIAGTPQLLKVINDHIQSGIYDQIAKEVESERMFGRLNGLSDIEAYRQVGDSIQARDGFNQVQGTRQQTPPAPVIVTPKPKQEDDAKLKEKKRAASSTKPTVSAGLPNDFNPLALSDDDFGKLVNKQF